LRLLYSGQLQAKHHGTSTLPLCHQKFITLEINGRRRVDPSSSYSITLSNSSFSLSLTLFLRYTHSILVPHKRQNNNEKPEAAAAATESGTQAKEKVKKKKERKKKKNLSHIFCCALFACSISPATPRSSPSLSLSFWTIQDSDFVCVTYTRGTVCYPSSVPISPLIKFDYSFPHFPAIPFRLFRQVDSQHFSLEPYI